jgi:gliding motility associated protien GldN
MKKPIHTNARSAIRVIRFELGAAIKLIVLLLALVFITNKAQAQCDLRQNRPTLEENVPHLNRFDRLPYPYSPLREADVMWSKRVWRTIDLREKINHPYYYPEVPYNGIRNLFDLIKLGLYGECIHAFDNPAMDDEFKTPMRVEQVAALLVDEQIVDVEDPFNPGTYRRDTMRNEITGMEIKAYWIKEDWFFDKQRSVMDVRILGICPLKEKKDPSTGDVIGYQPLFWIYFPELRPLLAKQETFLGQNFSQRPTYDEMFSKRLFGSYIHKESNVYDRPINSYYTGLDAQLDAERIKEDMRNFENDMWHY